MKHAWNSPSAGPHYGRRIIAEGARQMPPERASGEALPFTDGVFDLVTANMVLEHVAEPERLFREVERVLVPGGRFLIHTPNLHGYTTAVTRLLPDALLAPLAFLLHRRQSED